MACVSCLGPLGNAADLPLLNAGSLARTVSARRMLTGVTGHLAIFALHIGTRSQTPPLLMPSNSQNIWLYVRRRTERLVYEAESGRYSQ